MARRKPKPKKKEEELYFIGHGRGAIYTIFKDLPSRVTLKNYGNLLDCDGPYRNYEHALKDAKLRGLKIR